MASSRCFKLGIILASLIILKSLKDLMIDTKLMLLYSASLKYNSKKRSITVIKTMTASNMFKLSLKCSLNLIKIFKNIILIYNNYLIPTT